MEQLKNLKLFDLFTILQQSDDDFEKWLQQLGLLHTRRFCECGNEMTYKIKKERKNPVWRCSRIKNHEGKQITRGFYTGTFFENSHLSPKQIFQFTYYWCWDLFKQSDYAFQMDMKCDHTIVDWKNFCRDVAGHWYGMNNEKIGANGAVVEIDETVLTKPKYNRGKNEAVDQWFFGGVERGTKKCFIVAIPDKSAATLLPLIQQHIHDGATIVSDCWASYNRIDELPQMYTHYKVNHSENFVDPETHQHTNTIESTWQKFKAGHKKRFGTHRDLFATYLCDFLWRREFSGPDVFFNFWSQIAQLYPVA